MNIENFNKSLEIQDSIKMYEHKKSMVENFLNKININKKDESLLLNMDNKFIVTLCGYFLDGSHDSCDFYIDSMFKKFMLDLVKNLCKKHVKYYNDKIKKLELEIDEEEE